MHGSWISGGTILFFVVYISAILLLFGLVVFLMITAIKFMKEKNKHDQELLVKMDELIQLNKEQQFPSQENK